MASETRLQGKVAIVTGAGSRGSGVGNGRATAILCARSGARVFLVDEVTEWAGETRRMIADEGGDSTVVEADVSDEQSCREAVAAVISGGGRLDILVNNVGIVGPPGTATEVDAQDWDRAMQVNVKSMMLMSKHCIPEMRRRGGGAIVNIASVAGLFGGHRNLFYPTSKGAVVNLTRAMAAHHGSDGIRVNCVAPGMVYTPMVASGSMSAELRAERQSRSLLDIEGTGWDVGHAVVFLASDEARWVTGVVLPVDGGQTAAYAPLAAS